MSSDTVGKGFVIEAVAFARSLAGFRSFLRLVEAIGWKTVR